MWVELLELLRDLRVFVRGGINLSSCFGLQRILEMLYPVRQYPGPHFWLAQLQQLHLNDLQAEDFSLEEER